MINVQVRIDLSARRDEIDESLENGPFGRPVERPVADIDNFASLITVAVAEQIFEAVFANERITLNIEENISGRWFRSKPSPTAGTTGSNSYRSSPALRAST